MTDVDQVGQGWRFPLGASGQGGIALSSGTEKIEQSMRLILATYPGERPMRHKFGSRLRDFVFEGVTDDNLDRVAHEVRSALLQWEPRIDIAEVSATPDPNRASVILIGIDYVVKATMDWRNLVFPFYVIPEERED
ncbi:MAG: GPW/gp25 family protein [Jatrophihabitans sp.]